MMKSHALFLSGALLASTSWGTTAEAAPTSIGTFNAWGAYIATDANGKTCFAASEPQSSDYSQPIKGRGDAFFMITTVPSKEIEDQVSTIVGFPFREGSDVSATIDGTTYAMFYNEAKGETAWSVPNAEAGFVAAMKNGSRMSIRSTSRRGTAVTDNYSLTGVTAVLNALAKECT